MIAIFSPFEKVGDFELNKSIEAYLNSYDFTLFPKEGKYDSDKYNIEQPDITLFLDENRLVESIACDEELIYKGRNLIGMSIEEFISHTGEKYYGEIDELLFEDIGAQVWTKNDIIVTIIVSAYFEEEDCDS